MQHQKKTIAEKPIELVAYNLMLALRAKTKRPKLCRKDLTTAQNILFQAKVKDCLSKGLLGDNPFDNEERLFDIFLERGWWE